MCDRQFGLTYRAANYEHPLFLPSNPLGDLIGTLSERVPAGMGASDAVQFEEGCYPGQRYGIPTDTVVDFEVGSFGMDAGMEGVVLG